jgi:hypothetical protein
MKKYISYYWDRFANSTLCELVSLFGDKITAPEISNDYRNRIFNSWRTFWLFLGQIFCANQSCQEALKKAQMWLSISEPDEKKISSNTAGYCKARQRLSSDYLDDVQRQVCHMYHQQGSQIPDKHLWNGRPVKVVDGTSVSMPDTEENQRLYPQPAGQKKGCGFPVMKLVISFCLTTGLILSCRKGDIKRHERVLWREMWGDYQAGDVVLADCGFCSFADYALLSKKGIDCVMRLHQARKEKKIIKRFHKNDYLVQWDKGPRPPEWLTKEEWEKLTDQMVVRHVRVHVDIPGFRTKNLIVATTLLDAKKYPAEDIAELYRRRWVAEIFIRDIKITMGMDILRCKTPQMVHKELTLFIIAYNLIRGLIWETALEKKIDPYRISLAGSIATIRQWTLILAILEIMENENENVAIAIAESEKRTFLIQRMIEFMAADLLPKRSEIRVEPRAVKRRPKNYQLMTKPRKEFKEIPHRHKYKANKIKPNESLALS